MYGGKIYMQMEQMVLVLPSLGYIV